MRKFLAVLLSAIVFCFAFASCGSVGGKDDGKIKIVCTSHVVADWVNNIIPGDSDAYDVMFIGKKGVDMHNYQPSVADVRDINNGDILIYIGGESDRWVEDIYFAEEPPIMLRLMDHIHGMVCEAEHEDGHDHGHEHEHSADEHIWLSFENALLCTDKIAQTVGELDAASADVCARNLQRYQDKINEVYDEYKETVECAAHDTMVFADRFPFVYLMHELGLEYYAAFPGCSAESNAGFSTVITLSEKVDELSLPCVITIEDSSANIAKSVVENTDSKSAAVLSLDSMQVYRGGEFDYLDAMIKNLEVFKTALGCE